MKDNQGSATNRWKESLKNSFISIMAALVIAMLCGFSAVGQTGEAWRRQMPVPGGLNLLDLMMVSEREGWAVGEQGSIVHTINGGLTWERQQSGTTEKLNAVHFTDTQHGWAVGNAALNTTDGGRTWQRMENLPNYNYQAVDSFDGQTIIAVGINSGGEGAQLMRSTDGGATWTANFFAVPALYDVDMVSPTVGYLVGYRLIWKTTDGGATWLGVNSDRGAWTKVSFADESNGWAIGYDQHGVRHAWHTHNGGLTWRERDMSGAMTIHAVSAQVAWVMVTNFGTSRTSAYLTTDGGEHYTEEIVSENFIVYAGFFLDAENGWVAGVKTDESEGAQNGVVFRRGARRLNHAAGNRSDFDGDGKADLAVFRPGDATWLIRHSSDNTERNTPWGLSTDSLASEDYDGDGRTDIAVFREGNWYILQSSNNQLRAASFGTAGDMPQPGDYDGDGQSDVAVFRPSNGTWYIQSSQAGFTSVQFGQSGDRAVAADFDGDGKCDVAVYRQGAWYALGSRDGLIAQQFGTNTDVPVVGDYDGDGRADLAVFRDGTWYLQQSRDGFRAVPFGLSSDRPAPADFDGDDNSDVAVYRDGTWYALGSTAGFFTSQFGSTGDVPVSSARVP
jgi:photosystem II stability/assembly factor-like uncharacterized protein/(2Fe-2S) ferredoxin